MSQNLTYEKSSTNTRKIIQEGDFIIIRRQDASRLVQVDKYKAAFLGKQKLFLGGIIGKPYGSSFEVKGSDLHFVDPAKSRFLCSSVAIAEAQTRDNRFLVDDGKSQKLTKEQIEELKTGGVSGEQIVENLVENSTTFKDKTQYAQAKYLKKKQKKYINHVIILEPTTRLLSEMYFSQGPLKICNLRVDSLAQMLAMCNVMSRGRYVVFDSCFGLLTAAVLERLGDSGCVVQVYPGPGPTSSFRQAVYALNLAQEQLKKLLVGLPVTEAARLLLPPSNEVINHDKHVVPKITGDSKENSVEVNAREEAEEKDEFTSVVDMKDCEVEDKYESQANKSAKEEAKADRKAQRMDEQKIAKEILAVKNMDGLLVVSRHHPTNIVLTLLEFLAPSRPFAVFSLYQQPLVDCYRKLKDKGETLFLKLTETWLRSYQVLPDRTHPAINMSGSGGYLLTGIKVEPLQTHKKS
ncbi:tRNA (adenine(58)-N(1))-methyltransferase non-catalytic subunit TRM6-like [Limulus polyphemus]|uniref:tRNA (adenine(58)-N(1))-methyltransferase non-catalytic subunit TRM6 n=1 Tax=Limulus polyphemus TaxID=6850 RepID=A0ABM1B497_LIMPO|nr:tRNA (adenine(58)-N(1))-methyltransferase non-catalytic subunit TRM6-like [Limulus polyphemus]